VILGVERFLFLFAITIPFDIRDMKADHATGLKTIPLQIGEAKSVQLSILILVVFLVGTVGRYFFLQQWGIASAYAISGLTTLVFLTNDRIRKWSLYHYGALDGTLLLQGILMIIFYCLAF
jgi:4-hydroxybenzoate polyprenyltransferase